MSGTRWFYVQDEKRMGPVDMELEAEQDLGAICRQSTLSHVEVCRTLWAYRVIGVVRRVS
jgi:hypothetical protein